MTVPNRGVSRYTQRPFPAYRFVPGRSPHPTRDPEGHSYGHRDSRPQRFDAGQWQACGDYLYGVDLFNHDYWWEAHEAWEGCWIAAGRESGTGQFLQGLIQIAVACLKHHQGFNDVAGRMAREGLERIGRQAAPYLGINRTVLHEQLREYLSGDRPTPPRIELTPPP